MAYGIKYKFRFEATHNVTYEIRLLENDFSGTAIQRPLGSAPVLRMSQNDPFRATSLDLVLECQSDGEYVDLYTSDPRQYKVELRKLNSNNYWILCWVGFIATELYSEPDIAPPYDVKVTATDGLGVLKEYEFQTGFGGRTVREQLQGLLAKTGLTIDLYTISQLREYEETAMDFLDEVKIDLDYMEGKNCYEVLSELLTTMRCVITQWEGSWVIIRETDVVIQADGDVLGMNSEYRGINATYSLEIEDMTARIGQMGAADTDMWPVGYLTRRIVPAKKSVKVTSDWHLKNGADPIANWTGSGDYASGSSYWMLGHMGGTGIMANSMNLFSFRHDIKVTVKVSAQEWGATYGYPWMKVLAAWVEGGTTYYFDKDNGWKTSGSATGDEHRIDSTNWYDNPALAETIEVTIPAKNTDNAGYIAINVQGHRVKVYSVTVEILAGGGYKDTILIDNGSRGSAPDISISGGRELSTNLFPVNFLAGVFYRNYGYSAGEISTAFSDGSNTNKDFMSLTALAYAKSVAAPRIEVSGVLDFPASLFGVCLFLKSHGQWALVSSYEWNIKESELSFKAVDLPTATLEVDSEEIVSY